MAPKPASSATGEAATRQAPDNSAKLPRRAPERQYSAHELATTLLEAIKILLSETDSYVQYFELRFRLEEEHIRALKSMLEKQRELDLRING